MKMNRILAAIYAALLTFAWVDTSFSQSPATTKNWSVSIATGLTYQSIISQQGRRSLTIQNNNTNTDNCWINVDGSVVATNTTATSVTINSVGIAAAKASIMLQPGEAYTRYGPLIPNGPIVGTCTSNGDSLYVDTQ